jgi:hypothetical protein
MKEKRMQPLPDFVPSLVPSGTYRAHIVGEIMEKESQFDRNKHYLQLPLELEGPDGTNLDFTWTFSPRSTVFGELLLVLGGKKQPSGIIAPPRNYVGRPFICEIIQRPGKIDKTTMKNEVAAVRADVPNAMSKGDDSGEGEGGDVVPF